MTLCNRAEKSFTCAMLYQDGIAWVVYDVMQEVQFHLCSMKINCSLIDVRLATGNSEFTCQELVFCVKD